MISRNTDLAVFRLAAGSSDLRAQKQRPSELLEAFVYLYENDGGVNIGCRQ
jgi:hypothetical protein